ncbi:C39 family peptidase [Pseudomonas sp. BMS12]|uniref:C39 family peptidase n=1 Tax=Pseudomonas sp. BMS12 TaxID=1796033 RepID=UPI00129010DD|nr:C39 family peptidase [Pseudomonas sp. BMS12]
MAVALTLPPAPVSAQDRAKPFAVLPGGALAFKTVVSLRERRFANLVEQRTDFSCGAAALASILNEAYGWGLSEEMVIRGMLRAGDTELIHSQGFSMLDMKNYVESLGMRARGYRIEAQRLASIKVPTIVLLNVRGYKHFVVLLRTDNDWVYVGDPVLGHKKMTIDDFSQGWNGIVFAIIGPGYDRRNALLSPPEPLTARHRLDRFNPVKDAELMEFGFIQSDFF